VRIQLSSRIASIAVSVVLGLAFASGYAKDPALTSLGMQHFRDTAVVQQNPIDSTTYETAGYQTPGGPKSVPLTKIGKGVANCAVGECTYTERVAFSVDEEMLRRLATANAAGNAAVWTYTLSAKSGPDFRGELSGAEIAGLLAKVDELIYAPPAAKPKIADEVLKFDLGVAGMQVAATADQTNRAGILIPVAAGAANSGATIRLFRGTDRMGVAAQF
jgi:hypothetical protein